MAEEDEDEPFEHRLLGKIIARKYRLIEIQGAGYFSVVFVAHQLFCGHVVRPVAVKISRQTGLTEQTAPHLFRDALVLAGLLASSAHEGRRHLVQIHDMGLLPKRDGRAYLVMEWVDGQPLLAHMRAAGTLPAATAIRHLEQLCLAVGLVHEQGAVHRDIIPENILIDKRGDLRLVDFGLADFMDPEAGFVPGAGGGTFAYMAPETLLGRSTPASDVYSIGLVFYQLLAGGGPHLVAPWKADRDRDTSKDNHAIKAGLHFTPLSELHNEVRNEYRWLDAVILRCLDPDPARRFKDGAELGQALIDARAGKGVAAPAAGVKAAIERTPTGDDEDIEAMFREVRKLMAGKAFAKAIDRLDVHRPAEWATLDLTGARTLRALGQAFLGQGDPSQARECLEQLRSGQREKPILARPDYAAALSDLVKCYRALGLDALALTCQDEARQAGSGG